MNFVLRVGCIAVLGCGCVSSLFAQKDKTVNVWLTSPSRSILFQQQAPTVFSKENPSPGDPVISIDEKKTYQHIDGFGWALTDGSAQALMKMSPAARTALLQQLFTSDGDHIGGSYLRVSVGASDLSDHVYSYDDLPAGQTDTTLEHFDL